MRPEPRARRDDELNLEEALYELDRYRRGFENLDRQVRILDRERQKLAVVLNNARVGFLVFDDQLRLTWANPAIATGFGRVGATSPVGRACHEVLCGSESTCADCPARCALDGAAHGQLEVTAPANGEPRRWYVTASQVRSHLGATDEVLVMVQDLTDLETLRRSEASLSGQKRILEMMARGDDLDSVLGAIAAQVETESGRLLCAINLIDSESGVFVHAASPSLPESYADVINGLMPGDGVGCCGTAAHKKRLIVTEDIATDPLWDTFRDYMIATAGVRACWSTPILDSNDRVLGTFALYTRAPARPTAEDEALIETFTHLAKIAIQRDMALSERLLLEQQLRQSQKLEAIGTLAGGVAHDFNNLMTGVLGYVSLLRQDPDDTDRVLKAAGVIESAAKRASDLTSKLLGFARGGRYQSLPVDMNEVIDDVAVLLGHTIDKNIRLVTHRGAGPGWIQGDPVQMHQVLLNLTVNARDAMPDGGTLTLATRREGNPETGATELLVTVTDTGSGIPLEIQGRIFDPFFTTKELGRGTGMGLATAYGIVESHGGRLSFTSAPGQGTSFTFRLPAIEAPAVEPAPASTAPAPAPAGSAPSARILVVDDEPGVRDVCCDILGELGYRTIPAVDGQEAVEIYRRDSASIDLVILDMIMPRMGGRDCFRELKSLNPHVKAVLVTGYSNDESAREILQDGALGFLQKPYDMDQLAELVAGALGRVAA